MAYIVDLILVMQTLFWLVGKDRPPLERRMVKFAFEAYRKSGAKAQVHFEIKQYVEDEGAFRRIERDRALEKIEKLINDNRIGPKEVFQLKKKLEEDIKQKQKVGILRGLGKDEPWDVQSPSRSLSL
jgi:hypothetical protein